MKLRTVITTLIIILLILIIALLFAANIHLSTMNDEIIARLDHLEDQHIKIHEENTYQSKLIESIVANQHKPEPQKIQPKIEDKQSLIDTPTIIRSIPFIPLMMQKISHIFTW